MPPARLSSVDLIKRLIAFDTTSHKSNLALIDFVRGYLADHGIDSQLFEDETGQKANLYATVGSDDRPGIALSGHTDVVPVEGQNWSSDPFDPVERDDRIYGRGTCDMKSFIAIVLAKLPEFLDRGLDTPLHLSFSHDEEIGCAGVRSLIAGLEKMPVRPSGCIIGEPTDMKVIRGHKGKLSMECRVRGLSCHSSLVEHGVNAVEKAAAVIHFMGGMAERLRTEGPLDDGYDPPYTSLHTGVIHGGTQLNIVPQDCVFEFEFRNLPNENVDHLMAQIQDYAETELLPAMQAIDPATGFIWEPLSGFPGLDTPEDAEITQLALALAGANDTRKVAFGTEAGLFSNIGIPSVVCGPGSIEQAHKPDEFIALEQVARCEQFLDRLMDRVCAA
jgi:acetylornithine deacetylase